jgi:hypothetical protein
MVDMLERKSAKSKNERLGYDLDVDECGRIMRVFGTQDRSK